MHDSNIVTHSYNFDRQHQLLAFLQTLRNIKEISLKIIYFTQVVLITLEELPIITPQALKKRRRQIRSFCPSFPRKVHCYLSPCHYQCVCKIDSFSLHPP